MTYEEQLRARIGRDTSVQNGPYYFEGPIIEVGRDEHGLYVDVDYGYRFTVDEEQPLEITEPDDPKPLGEWVRETHPHLFKEPA